MAAPSATAAALHCNGVLISIVQCLVLPAHVVAFLDALPSQVLGASLRALRTLLSRPGQFLHEWPKPCFLGLVDDEEALASAALPAYEAIDDFLYPMTAIDVTCSANLINEAVCQALRRCTRLREVSLDSSPIMTHVFQAVAHHVSRLNVVMTRGDAVDWTPLVTSWLASGHAEHLSLRCIPVATDALARAVSRTPTLRSLAIFACDDVVEQLLGIGEPLRHLTRFSFGTKVPVHVGRLLDLVDIRSLTSVTLSCSMPLHPVFDTLCGSSALEELVLCWCSLTVRNENDVVGHWPRLRVARFDGVNFSADFFDTLVASLTSSHVLEHVGFQDCSIVSTKMNVLGPALVHWINHGLRILRLSDDPLDDSGAAVLAAALRHASNTAPLTLSLVDNNLSLVGVTDLLSALASCTCVRVEIEVSENLQGHRDELVAIATNVGIKAICDDDVVEFYSPLAIQSKR
ncbi:hypothetical protein SPRG_14226 [Saprolegnia parasitica CBS 223.65]|uniref:F-box domain-containing protein n=1 Tax=Saprolegnia parasitica (strain CBS 223.65) TaxID=695850 RepID=A0A067BZT5_SAPPC|nr:hypothetical protein SPRG_14226 [Saprolegnia parasitica CBS 223.65]KDO20077.1 hypothetical protein SPRG_14226 [Saprolegnia parasitica CBS 223.65]|eukprot:XP_012209237.1 hypothetical protein SPRG_14226 [Saprolegnia parasitica CBS 223.65]